MPAPSAGPARRRVLAAGLAGAGALFVPPHAHRARGLEPPDGPPRRGPAPADLALVCALDGSESISTNTLAFQLRGHAAAFRDPAVVAAITAGGQGAIVVAVAAWSGPGRLEVLVPWRRVEDPLTSVALADAIDAAPRDIRAGATAIGSAVTACLPLFDAPGAAASRQVIDLVANGFSNSGLPTATARSAAEAAGVTVNALAILNEFPWLEDYLRTEVIAGIGAFTRAAGDFDSFSAALRAKLIAEIV